MRGIYIILILTISLMLTCVNICHSSEQEEKVVFYHDGIPSYACTYPEPGLCKVDLKDKRKIILPMAEHLSEKLNAPYFETSALTGEIVKEVFQKIGELVFKYKEK